MTYLKSRNKELEILEDNPFRNDKLDRAKLGAVLTDVVSYYGQSGCVMALNGKWGSGKTTFVKMWGQYLRNQGFKTLYFNAWTSDYTNDPLMAMVLELRELSSNNEMMNKIVSGAARISISVLNSILKKYVGVDSAELESALSETTKIGKEYLQEFAKQKATTEEFKRNVIQYVADNAGEHPVVFFVDELDRCNPHYAVSVLERIKHLFDIPNIIFVLAINKVELSNAIQGYYGSTNIKSNEYLRRFIDIEYTLPTPKLKDYCEYLYDEYAFGDFFESEIRQRYFGNEREDESFKNVAECICDAAQPNLRQIERVYAYTRLALMQFSMSNYLIPDIFFLLCFWKVMNPTFYNKIRRKEYSALDLLSNLETVLPKNLLVRDVDYIYPSNFYYVIAGFIYGYDITNLNGRITKPSLAAIKNEVTQKNDYQIKTKIIEKQYMNEALDYYYTHRSRRYDYGLSYIFDRIDLLDSFKI